ncbi:hypothetical protein E0L36_09575 [Streptomyces sp. AJS327]|uniref:DMT family transporter n=1 Tax=Streptomyces sp. AJS327 TaxID=2545265 RepID=UPI0015DFF224|nr:DMT family transporter [Streptomyces sp. AJS327]MBA0051133.1 hypothetical protein [Streptomyces sp. AJS327]
MSPLVAAVLLSVLSAVCYASAAIVQERIAATTAPSRYGLLRSGRWWGAVVLQGSGALLHVLALWLGPLLIVQPLGVLTLVLAAPMAALLVKRPVSAAGKRGIALVSAGLAVLLLLTGGGGSNALGHGEQLALAAVVLGSLAGLTTAAVALRRRAPRVRSVALATAAGIAYGAASVFLKAVSEEWEGWALSSATALPVLLLIAVLATTGLATSQASYRGTGLAAPLATTTVVNPVVAAAAGLLLLNEGFRYGLPGALAALLASAVAAWGLFALAAEGAGRRDGPGGGGRGGSSGPPAEHPGRGGEDRDEEAETSGPVRPLLIPRPAAPPGGPPASCPAPAQPAPRVVCGLLRHPSVALDSDRPGPL